MWWTEWQCDGVFLRVGPTSVFAANIQPRYSVHSDNCVLRFDIDQRFGLVLGRRKQEVIQICREREACSLVVCRLSSVGLGGGIGNLQTPVAQQLK